MQYFCLFSRWSSHEEEEKTLEDQKTCEDIRLGPSAERMRLFPKDDNLGELMSNVCVACVRGWAGVGACSADWVSGSDIHTS